MCSIIGYLGSSISAQDLRAGFDKTISRGPDDTRMLHIGAATLGFHRLAIMGLHPEGMQPFTRDGSALVCNGEIYGFRPIRERSSLRARRSRVSPIARSCSRYTSARGWTCSAG